jgi:hypothetical protein
MNTTKKYILGIAVASAFFCNGCTDFLEESNPNKVVTETYYQTEADIDYAANGAYVALRGTGYYTNMWIYTDLRSESTSVQDPGAGNGINYQFYNYAILTDNTEVKRHWTALYTCVTRCNVVLDHIDDIAFESDTRKNQIKAEMWFLRALTYFHLVVQWGDVPVVTKELKTKEEIWEHTKRDPKAEVYRLIEEDLRAVIGSELPNRQTGGGVGRASKVAAYALLGKVLLTKAADTDFAADRDSNLQEAKANLTEAWTAKPFANLKDIAYADVFDKEKQISCPENIFQVMFVGGDADLSSNYAYNFQPSAQTGLTSTRGGSGNNIPTPDMINEYEVGDSRKNISCGTASNGVNYVKKYTDLDNANGYGANDWIVLRYADVALLLAEVKMHLDEPDAAAYITYVRERAGLTASTNPNLRDAIVHERKVELAYEGHSWYDLLRLYSKSELKTLMQAKNANFYDKDFLLPIPYDEYKLDPERMYQNEGYN